MISIFWHLAHCCDCCLVITHYNSNHAGQAQPAREALGKYELWVPRYSKWPWDVDADWCHCWLLYAAAILLAYGTHKQYVTHVLLTGTTFLLPYRDFCCHVPLIMICYLLFRPKLFYTFLHKTVELFHLNNYTFCFYIFSYGEFYILFSLVLQNMLSSFFVFSTFYVYCYVSVYQGKKPT